MRLRTILLLLALTCWLSDIAVQAELVLTSPAFTNSQAIPAQYTCQGKNVNPSLLINGVPEEAKSLALIVDDPDAPSGEWVHWVVYNISPFIGAIHENSVPGIAGSNDFQTTDYQGPCPPQGTHRYVFKLYALNAVLAVKPGMTKTALTAAMAEHILGVVHLTGTFSK
jgi:Raf kinase inhibitor-like YbhB/YbcL family protein